MPVWLMGAVSFEREAWSFPGFAEGYEIPLYNGLRTKMADQHHNNVLIRELLIPNQQAI